MKNKKNKPNDSLAILNGTLLNPVSGKEEKKNIYIRNGVIFFLPERNVSYSEINAEGLFIAPALIDIHVHLREPGNEEDETISSGSTAAVKGGFGTVLAMPNTKPPVDSADMILRIITRSSNNKIVRILPAGCLTEKREGRKKAKLIEMSKAGAMAFTDDGTTVHDNNLMRDIMFTLKALNKPLLDHAMDCRIAGDGVIRRGYLSRRLKLKEIPAAAEYKMVERDIALCKETGCRVHIQHISTFQSLQLLAEAQRKGLPITAEATPHHLLLCNDDIKRDDANFKMNPPLGTSKDREQLQKAVKNGIITAFATDHAPHSHQKKKKGFRNAPFGIIGMETAVGATYELVVNGIIDRISWLRLWTIGPAKILSIPPPVISENSPANIVILDLTSPWTVDPEEFLSKSRNTPFTGKTFTGRAVMTIIDGRIVYKEI